MNFLWAWIRFEGNDSQFSVVPISNFSEPGTLVEKNLTPSRVALSPWSWRQGRLGPILESLVSFWRGRESLLSCGHRMIQVSGKWQITRNTNGLTSDHWPLEPLLLTPEFSISCCDWSPNGVFIAVSGSLDDCAQVNVYNCSGQLLTLFRAQVPSISTLSWDSESTNLAMASGPILHISSARPIYKFASNGTLHAYAFATEGQNLLAFWDKQIVIDFFEKINLEFQFNLNRLIRSQFKGLMGKLWT